MWLVKCSSWVNAKQAVDDPRATRVCLFAATRTRGSADVRNWLGPEMRSQLSREFYGCFDLFPADRHALHVEAERHAESAAVVDELDCCHDRLVEGRAQRVRRVPEV